MSLFTKILLLFILFPSFNAWSTSIDRTRAWVGVFNRKPLSPDYHLWQEAQFRYDLNLAEMNQVLFRFGLLKNLNEKHEIGFIMGYVQSNNLKEYRPTLQHAYTHKFSDDFILNTRERLEWRDIENNDENSVRLRTLFGLRKVFNKDWSILLWDEVFTTYTHEAWTSNRFYERNRLFLGPRFELLSGRLEIGYLNQYIPRDPVSTYEHTLVLYYFY